MFFLCHPYLLRCDPFFERRDACKTKENDVRARGVAIANHCVIANLLLTVVLLSRSFLVRRGPLGSGALIDNWLNAALCLLNLLDRYRTSSAIGSVTWGALSRALSRISPRTVVGLVGGFVRINSRFEQNIFCESTFQKMDSSEERTRITGISMRIGEKTRFARIWPSASKIAFFCLRIDSRESAKRWCANRLPTKVGS